MKVLKTRIGPIDRPPSSSAPDFCAGTLPPFERDQELFYGFDSGQPSVLCYTV